MKAAFVVSLVLACQHGEAVSTVHTTGAELHDELDRATKVLGEMTRGTEIGDAQRERARCVMVIPSVGSGAFIVGGSKVHGVISCRTRADWSAPAFVTLTGLVVGPQAGGRSADMIVLELGAKDLVTYARTKGAFADADLRGVKIEADEESTNALYRGDVPFEAKTFVDRLRSSFPSVR